MIDAPWHGTATVTCDGCTAHLHVTCVGRRVGPDGRTAKVRLRRDDAAWLQLFWSAHRGPFSASAAP